MNIKFICKVEIPETFICNNYEVHLHNKLVGRIICSEDVEYKFLSDDNNSKFILDITYEDTKNINNLIERLKYMILNAYNTERSSLQNYDIVLSSLIDYVIDKSKCIKTLFIGYDFNYPLTITTTLEKCNFECDKILLKKNIELYDPSMTNLDNDFTSIFENIHNTVEENNYERFVIDIPNLTLRSKYKNTKNVLNYLSSKNKKIMLIVPNHNGIESIFGDYYLNCIDKKYLINYYNDLLTQNMIKNILE